MCDEGRFTYKALRDERLAAPRVGDSPPTGTARCEAAGKKLRAALDADASKVGVVFSAQTTNEDNFRSSALAFEHLHVGKAYLAGRDQGWHDDILVAPT